MPELDWTACVFRSSFREQVRTLAVGGALGGQLHWPTLVRSTGAGRSRGYYDRSRSPMRIWKVATGAYTDTHVHTFGCITRDQWSGVALPPATRPCCSALRCNGWSSCVAGAICSRRSRVAAIIPPPPRPCARVPPLRFEQPRCRSLSCLALRAAFASSASHPTTCCTCGAASSVIGARHPSDSLAPSSQQPPHSHRLMVLAWSAGGGLVSSRKGDDRRGSMAGLSMQEATPPSPALFGPPCVSSGACKLQFARICVVVLHLFLWVWPCRPCSGRLPLLQNVGPKIIGLGGRAVFS